MSQHPTHIRHIDADAIGRVARQLCLGRPVVLPLVSVGAYTPAVRTDATPAFVVLNLQGSPLAYAHDAFEAAVQALRLGSIDATSKALRAELVHAPDVQPTDRYIAAAARLDRLQSSEWSALARADYMVQHRRNHPKDWTPLHKLAANWTVAELVENTRPPIA